MRANSDGMYGQQRTARAIRPAWSVYSYLDGQALGSIPVLSGTITDDEGPNVTRDNTANQVTTSATPIACAFATTQATP